MKGEGANRTRRNHNTDDRKEEHSTQTLDSRGILNSNKLDSNTAPVLPRTGGAVNVMVPECPTASVKIRTGDLS